MIISITAPSGTGKTTLLKDLFKVFPDINPLLSVTTRTRRESDALGEYEYVPQDAFNHMIETGQFLWHVDMHGNRYGTRKADVDRALDMGIYMPILVPSAVKVLYEYARNIKKDTVAHFWYLEIEDELETLRRLTKRGDSREDIERRMEECRVWNEESHTLGVPFYRLDASKDEATTLDTAVREIKRLR